MIAHINGILLSKSPQSIVVDVNGVGYQVYVPLTTYYQLPEEGTTVSLHIHTHVKDGGINLFGFYCPQQRDTFQLLIGVNGVGPKLAVNILSGIETDDLLHALIKGDVKKLTSIPGVGKKTAERMCVELKEKAAKMASFSERQSPKDKITSTLIEEAISALVNLGYKNQTAKKAVDQVWAEINKTDLTFDLLLKNALKILAP